jgi:hypothetical protein
MFLLKRIFISLLLISAAAITTYAQTAAPTASPVWRNTPATPSGVNQRIEDAAIDRQDIAPIPRALFYDIGYPGNDEEFSALDGNAILLVTALSQGRLDLPLERVFVVMEDGSEVPLKQVKLVLSQQAATETLTTKVFGPYRADALYLLPVYLRLKPVELHVEFGSHAKLKAATFGGGASNILSRFKVVPPVGTGPTDMALNAFIKREFPGF